MSEKRFSAIISVRIDAKDMDSAIKELQNYLDKNDYLCHLHYIVEEANENRTSDGKMMMFEK